MRITPFNDQIWLNMSFRMNVNFDRSIQECCDASQLSDRYNVILHSERCLGSFSCFICRIVLRIIIKDHSLLCHAIQKKKQLENHSVDEVKKLWCCRRLIKKALIQILRWFLTFSLRILTAHNKWRPLSCPRARAH